MFGNCTNLSDKCRVPPRPPRSRRHGPGLSLLLDHVEQVGADVVWSEKFGGPAEMPGEAYDAVDIDDDGARGELRSFVSWIMRRRSGVMVNQRLLYSLRVVKEPVRQPDH